MKTYWDSSALVEALHDTAMRARIKKPDHATRPHALPEVFSTLPKGVNYRYPPADAANMLGDLVKDLEFVELDKFQVFYQVPEHIGGVCWRVTVIDSLGERGKNLG